MQCCGQLLFSLLVQSLGFLFLCLLLNNQVYLHDSLGLYEVWKLCVGVLLSVTSVAIITKTKRAVQMLFASSLSVHAKAGSKLSGFVQNIINAVEDNAAMQDEVEKIDHNLSMQPHFA